MDALKNKASLFEFSSFFIVNATCHFNTMKSFKIQYSDLPTLVIYNGNDNSYSKMNEPFSLETGEAFIEKVRSRSAPHEKLKREAVVVNRFNCTKENTHKDLKVKFDYGRKETEEDDFDTSEYKDDRSEEVDNSLNEEFAKRYYEVLREHEEKNKKSDL